MFVVTLTSSCSNKNPTQDQTLDKTFVNLTESDGLPNNSVYALGSDENGNLWIGYAVNGGGVTKYDGSTWKNFTTNDGLARNSVYAMVGDENGNLWFSFGNNGNGICRYGF